MPVKRVRVALAGRAGHVDVEQGATAGATLGVNLYNEDGTLVTLEQIAAEIVSAVFTLSEAGGSTSPGTTDALPEGTSNLYYTDARADARIAAAMPAVMARQMVGF